MITNQPNAFNQANTLNNMAAAIQNPDTLQAMANLGLTANIANVAGAMSPAQLQQLSSFGQSFQDEYGIASQPNYAFMMPPAAQMPYNAIMPSIAFAGSVSTLAPSYYSGAPQMTMPQMLNQMQSQFPASQEYLQQVLGQPAMQQGLQQFYGNPAYMNAAASPGGPFGGLAGLNNSAPTSTAGMPGAQGSNVPGAGNLTQEQAKTQQDAMLKQQMDNWNEAMQLWSGIESAEHNVRSSIIQNIR